jgi:3-deoxy-D-manno-octulosonate 8-phosphate phosphatase (KDO 8-P phosphatase)
VVVIATDDQRISDAVKAFGGHWVMTSGDHPSGTDRLAEVMLKIGAEIFINLHGDEPLVRPSDIDLLAEGILAEPAIKVGMLSHEIAASQKQTQTPSKWN